MCDALATSEIAGAGIDAWYRYPASEGDVQPPSNLLFHTLSNVVMSPHRAADAEDRTKAQITDVAKQLNRIASGQEPLNILWKAKSRGKLGRMEQLVDLFKVGFYCRFNSTR